MLLIELKFTPVFNMYLLFSSILSDIVYCGKGFFAKFVAGLLGRAN